jgi:tRNA(fMet)-specific endonuclease VapC
VIAAAVVDTDVVSYLFRGDTRAELYRPHLTDRLLIISFMTLAELRRWALKYNWGRRRREALGGSSR